MQQKIPVCIILINEKQTVYSSMSYHFLIFAPSGGAGVGTEALSGGDMQQRYAVHISYLDFR